MTDVVEHVAEALRKSVVTADDLTGPARAAIRTTLEAMQDRLFKRGIDPSANDYIDQLIKELGDAST